MIEYGTKDGSGKGEKLPAQIALERLVALLATWAPKLKGEKK